MNLYLVQHAEAVSKELDPERPLSAKGLADIGKVAAYTARNCGIKACQVYHSGKLRARQTAEVLTTHLKLPAPVEADGLAPLDDPTIWAKRLEQRSDSIMLVGHLPHMGKLASTLLCGVSETNPVQFQMAGVVALSREEDRWSLQWMIVPAIIP